MTDRTGPDGQPPVPSSTPPGWPPAGPAAAQPWGAAPPPYGAPPPQYGPPPQYTPQPGPPVQPGPAPQYGAQPQWGAAPQWGGAPQEQPWGAPGAPGWGGGGPQMWLARPKPGIVPLRPLSLGEILDGAFQAIRTNPRTMIGVSAIVVAVATLLTTLPSAALLTDLGGGSLFEPGAAPTAEDFASLVLGTIRASLPGYVVLLVATAVLGALLTISVSNAVLGVRTGGAALWRRVRPRLGAVLGLSVLLTLLSLGVAGVLVGPGIAILRYGDPLTGALVLLAGAVPAVLVSLALTAKLGLAAPSLLLEDRSPASAIARSWQLTRGSFWRVLGILLLASIIQGIGAAVVSAPFGLVAGLVTGAAGDPSNPYDSFWGNVVQLLISGLGQTIGSAVFYPFSAAVTTLLYLDVRMRREGLDVELVRHVEGGPAA